MSEEVAANLAVQVVVTVAQFHHPRARELQRTITDAIEALRLRERADWTSLITAFEVFARELHHHMRDEEAHILDRVQFLMVRRQLTYGAMSDARHTFEVLMKEHDKMCVLRRRLELELSKSLHLEPEPGASTVRNAMREFMTAFQDHNDFEQRALAPTMEPFLSD